MRLSLLLQGSAGELLKLQPCIHRAQLRGQDTQLKVAMAPIELQRARMQAHQQIVQAHTDPQTGQIDHNGVTSDLLKYGLTTEAEAHQKFVADKQAQAKNATDMMDKTTQAVREGFSGAFDDNPNITDKKGAEADAANQYIAAHPDIHNRSREAIAADMGNARSAARIGVQLRNPQNFGVRFGDRVSGRTMDSQSNIPDDSFYAGSKLGDSPVSGLGSWLPGHHLGETEFTPSDAGQGSASLRLSAQDRAYILARQLAARNAALKK